MRASDPLPPGATVGSAGERALLQRLRARIPPAAGVVVGPGDDAAVVRTRAETLVTTDTLVEGVHFRREWSSPRLVGRKALSVNLSDVAGMGGRGLYATVSLCLPPTLEIAWLEGLYDGLLERAAESGTALVGGNLSGTPGPVVVDVMVLGEAVRPLLRRGARAGDLVVVTGTPGAAAAGLGLLEAGVRLGEDGELAGSRRVLSPAEDAALRSCLRAQLDPAPPLALGSALSALEAVHAGMDVSDGLSRDLRALCVESGLAAVLQAQAVRRAGPPDLRDWGAGDPMACALHGGEDYGLLLAVDAGGLGALQAIAGGHDVRLSVIGSFEPGAPEIWLAGEQGREPVPPRAHEHFSAPGGA
jgi:thiamine-monophosphate kinase